MRVLKNFFLYHRTNIVISLILNLGFAFVFFKNLDSNLADLPNFDLGFSVVATLVSLVIVTYQLQFLDFDFQFLKNHLGRTGYHLVRWLQIVLIAGSLAMAFAGMGHLIGFIPGQVFLWIPLMLVPASGILAFGLLPLQGRRVTAKVFLKANKQASRKGLLNLLAFQKTYLLRRHRRKLLTSLGSFLIFLMGTIAYSLREETTHAALLCLVPFVVPLLFSIDCNADAFFELRRYRSQTKGWIYITDLIFWSLLMGLPWVALNLGLAGIGRGSLVSGVQGWLILELCLAYSLLIKIRFLKSGFLRSLVLAFSVGIPFVIPVFAGLGIWEIYNDKNS